MPDEKKNDAEEDEGLEQGQDASGGRWNTDTAGIESIGSMIEVEDLSTPEQKEGNAKAARWQEEFHARTRKRAAEIGDESENADEGHAKEQT